jgi:tetraacyldisaccharide 4'-kinase
MKKILSELFKIAVIRKNKNFDSGKRKIHKCVSPVISVGNLSIGGSGKTPFVQTLTRIIKEIGFKPAIVGRGYKRKSKGEIIVSDGTNILVDAKTGGDEMLLLAETLKVPVVANEMKYIGALRTESMFEIDCIIIDDGFQHRFLYRDLDILLIDSETLENPYLIPKGRLREPLDSMKRTDVICLLGNIEPKKFGIEQFLDGKLVLKIKAEHGKPYFLNSKIGIVSDDAMIIPNDKKVIAICGIAKPKNFQLMIEALNYIIIENVEFDDHHYYKISDIEYIINKCKNAKIGTLATTEKDAVKLKEFGNVFAENNINVLVFPIFMKIEQGEDELRRLLKDLIGKNL